MSIPFLLDKKPHCCTRRLGRRAVGRCAKVPYGAARSNSERAAPSVCVGKRYWKGQKRGRKPLLMT